MYITSIKLKNYRNYEEIKISPLKDINLIYGKNAQGKTNLIESIYLTSTGRSHRTSKELPLVKENKEGFYIKIKGMKEEIPFKIEIKYRKGEKKQIKLNNLPVTKLGELIGVLNTVIFSPEDLQIIKQGPSERRRFIDILISQTNNKYFYQLQIYHRLIKQKNALLKKKNINKYIELLDIYNEKIAETAFFIINERIKFLRKIAVYFNNYIKKLSNNQEFGEITYFSSLGNTMNEIKKTLVKNKNKEIKSSISICGPHRDDFTILINNKDVKQYGSQGQQRTAVLSLKLAEIDIIKNETGYYPVLLLDDVMSELDISRRKFLTESIKTKQTFITSTEKKNYVNFKEKTTFFYVHNGQIDKR
ncbi:MAG: DNA replication/repair protein RecF [Clostridiales bacterium]|nr:DNA replication/repair protein RecF [Clostridiales bacterium]